jgi:hypothetical protein
MPADRCDLAGIRARLEHVERPASVFAHAVPQAMYTADVAALLGECDRLRQALRRYGAHLYGCALVATWLHHEGHRKVCTCGLAEARATGGE